MDIFLTQIILGAKDFDGENLINILFVVVVAVFYIIGGFIKAKAKKNESEELPDESIPEPDYPEKHPFSKGGQAKYRQPAQPKLIGIERKLADIAKLQEFLLGPVEAIHQIEEPAEQMQEPVKLPKQKDVDVPEKAAPHIKSLLKLESSDDLKKAVLYHEILGKPVGFRD